MLIGSPPFSSLQNRSKRGRNAKEFAEKLEIAKNHIRFCAELYQMQLDGGRYFLHGHPSNSTSWSVPEMVSLAAKPGVGLMTGDMCAYGMKISDKAGEALVKKSIRFLSNSPEVLKTVGPTLQQRRGREP